MNGTLLFNLGDSPLHGPAGFLTLALIVGLAACLVIYLTRRRAGTLQPEARVVLLGLGGILGLTLGLTLLTLVPDILSAPKLDRGRVIKVYSQILDPESGPITRVALSDGTDLIIPDLLGSKLVLGTCVELAETPATHSLLSARQLDPAACEAANNSG